MSKGVSWRDDTSTLCDIGEHTACHRSTWLPCSCICHAVEALNLDPLLRPCAECGAPSDHPIEWAPDSPPIPLCTRHWEAVSVGSIPLPAWCDACGAWRPAPHFPRL